MPRLVTLCGKTCYSYPLVIKHGWLENTLFLGDFPMNTSIYRGFSIAMFDYQRVGPVRHTERPVSRYLVATFGPQMRERGKGHIVNISSVAGVQRSSILFQGKWMQCILYMYNYVYINYVYVIICIVFFFCDLSTVSWRVGKMYKCNLFYLYHIIYMYIHAYN